MDSFKLTYPKIVLAIFLFSLSLNVDSQVEEGDTTEYAIMLLGLESRFNLDYALMNAASEGNILGIKWLMRHGADIDASTSENITPLLFATANKKREAVKTLLRYGPDVNIISKYGETPLLVAVKNNDVEISELLVRDSADVNFADRFGATPLHYASIYGYFYVADLLLYYEAATYKKTNDGATPLIAAVWAGNADIADLLIQNGANPEERDKMGFTPFLIAAQNGDTVIMEMLIKRHIDLYEINNFKYNALDICIKDGNFEAVKYLMNKGDKWASGKYEAVSPYYVASVFGRKQICEILVKNHYPKTYKYGFNQVTFSGSAKVTSHDIYTGFSLSLKEPKLKAGVFGGVDFKPFYSRVLVKKESNLYYQYMDKSSLAYAGIFRDFSITDKPLEGNLIFGCSLAAGYSFGNKLKGTEIAPGNKLRIIPGIAIKWQKNDISLSGNIDYLKSDFYKVGPIWFRAGFSYSIFYNNLKAPVKDIKWY